jgi:pyruvate formate lyase activating enzyme
LDGVVISGGEPTLQPDLISFALRLHERGFLVKLDTNGYLPDRLDKMIAARAVDYVAMDIKAPQRKYSNAAGVSIDLGRIQRSIDLLLGSGVPYEFRTTVAPGLLLEDDILQIARWIAEASHYYLQQFVPHDTIDPGYLARVPYSSERLLAMADLARPWVGQVGVRGI